VIVRKINNIVKLPPSISLAVGAMLPTGGTLAMSAVISCQKSLDNLVNQKGELAVGGCLREMPSFTEVMIVMNTLCARV
jgi:hypothetical protein